MVCPQMAIVPWPWILWRHFALYETVPPHCGADRTATQPRCDLRQVGRAYRISSRRRRSGHCYRVQQPTFDSLVTSLKCLQRQRTQSTHIRLVSALFRRSVPVQFPPTSANHEVGLNMTRPFPAWDRPFVCCWCHLANTIDSSDKAGC